MKKSDINILIIEDDASIRSALGEAVKRAGYRPILAGKVEEAFSACKIKTMHAAVIDCMLPVKNGVDVAVELRASAMKSAPIIMMSGVFKDPTFAADAKKKTGAVEFLYKPFNNTELIKVLDDQLGSLVDAPKVALHSLLSKPFASNRERKKAIDHVEEIMGYDLPLILSIFMDAESSGHLNIVNEAGEIYGVTMVKGKIVKVDSSESSATMSILLMKHGFVTSKDLEELMESKKKGDLLKNLVAESLVSPHAVPIIQGEQMFTELKRLVTGETMQINFVPDRKLKDDGLKIDMGAFAPVLHEVIDLQIPGDWLRSFFADWMDHPILLGPNYSKEHQVMSLPVLTRVKEIVDSIESSPTPEEILNEGKYSEEHILKALHLMAVRRLIVFDESRRSASITEHIDRLRHMLSALEGKNPIQVFQYFGAGENPKPKNVTAIYKEFAKSNHPDKLPSSVDPEVKKLNHRVFTIVSDAHDVLTNEGKRQKFLNDMQTKEAQKQMTSEQLAEAAIIKLRRGMATDAAVDLKKAYETFPTNEIQLYMYWAIVKANPGKIKPTELVDMESQLGKFSSDEKRTANFQFVLGLIKAAKGEVPLAASHFKKALDHDPGFLDARREMSQLKGSQSKDKMDLNELLTGDLTSIVGNIFKKKS